MLRRTGIWACAFACGLGTFSATHFARAQVSAEQKATAEAVFEEGIRLIKQGNFVEACPKFEMSQRVEPAVGTMLYLAECYEKTNRTASSWAMFREAASLAENSGQTERMKTAQARAARLEPHLAWLTIEVAKDAVVPGLQIRRNNVYVSSDLSGTPTPVDPGDVTVDASAPGHLPFSTKVKVAAEGRVVVAIPALALAPDSVLPASPPAANHDSAPSTAPAPASQPASVPAASPAPVQAEHASALPWVVGGVGVVALGVGGYFGLKSISKANDARDICPKGICNTEQGATAASDARSAAKLSNVSFAIGAVAVATGAVLYFALPTKHSAQVGMLPLLEPTSVGLAVRGGLDL